MTLRNIIEIDEALCNGCGQCILDCAEGALRIVDGKAKVIADSLCDGLGACLSGCPTGALTVVQREAPAFDEAAVHAHVRAHATAHSAVGSVVKEACRDAAACACPGARPQEFVLTQCLGDACTPGTAASTRHWPVKVRLAPGSAPFLRGQDVLITADCAGAASSALHTHAAGRVMLIACPKFEDKAQLTERIRAFITESGLRRLDVLRMEVPCCAALTHICRQAALEAGAAFTVREWILRRDGALLGAE